MTGTRPSLTPKQQRFVDEYLVDLNATQAAIRAGYSAATANEQGSQNLAKLSISDAIAAARAEQSARTGITADRVLAELAKIGFADIRKAVRWSSNVAVAAPDERSVDDILEDGPELRHAITNQVELIDSTDIDDDTAAAIAEVSMTDKGSLKVKFHDKKGALTELGRHLGIFTDKVEHSGGVIVEINE